MIDLLDIINERINSLTYVGIGYVIVPSDVNREEYIANCYLTESVSIYPEIGSLSYNNVKVSVNCLNNLEFPEGGQFGSCVVYILHPTQKIPIIIGILSKTDESFSLNYKLFKLMKSLGNNSVSITGDGENGNLLINVHSDTDEGGQIIIDVNNYSETGLFKLKVRGNIVVLSKAMTLEASEEFNLKSKIANVITEEFTLDSKTTTLKGDKIKFLNKEVELGEKNLEYAVLGDSLKNDIIKPLLAALKSFSVIVSSMGPTTVVSPETLIKLEAIEDKLEKILSQKVKVE